MHTSLYHQIWTNNPWYQYKQFYEPFYYNLHGNIISERRNKYAHVIGTSYGWSLSHPIKTKVEAYFGLDLMQKCDRITLAHIVDGAPEFIDCDYKSKVRLTLSGWMLKKEQPRSLINTQAGRWLLQIHPNNCGTTAKNLRLM